MASYQGIDEAQPVRKSHQTHQVIECHSLVLPVVVLDEVAAHRSGAFKRLEFVTTLALSHCDIETLEDGAFEGMVALTEVRLESNRLQYLQGSGLFPHNLNHIEVSSLSM